MNESKNRKSIITLRNIDFTYSSKDNEVTALQDINLDISEGEFICVLGPSGCGKSTLLKIVAGLLKPSTGEALVDNESISGPDWHRSVLFQEPPLYPWLNVQENIAFGLKMRKLSKQEITQLISQYIDFVDLKGFEQNKPYELSYNSLL